MVNSFGVLLSTTGNLNQLWNVLTDDYFEVSYLTQKALEPLLPEHEEASPVVPEPKHLTNPHACNCLPH